MNISVFGLGYVGCVTAACFAARGHKVIGVDINPDKVEAINSGKSPILERGLDELIGNNVEAGYLSATDNVADAISHGRILLISVGTPSEYNGNINLRYIERVCSEIGHALRATTEYKVVVFRSTLLPGILDTKILPILTRESGKQIGVDFGIVVNPEFLREGSSLDDFENPPFTLIGQMDEHTGDLIEELYTNIPAPIIRTTPDAACMVKYACNAFHGLKVVFANEIGQVCKKLNIDGIEVMEIFCKDTNLNISPRYLRPGFAFGGSCLPKDLRALLHLARHQDLDLPVLDSILPSNQLQIQNAIDMVLRDQRKNVGIIGLTFKPDTDDLRESPMVKLVEVLSGKGLNLKIYDDGLSLPRLVGGNKAYIEQTIPHLASLILPSMDAVVNNSDIIVIGHNSENVQNRLFDLLTQEQLLIDLVRITPETNQHSYEYEGIGW
jgi:GDP-mannose 6-dehydrogenase